MGYLVLAAISTCITAFLGYACLFTSDNAEATAGFIILCVPMYIGSTAALIMCILLHATIVSTILWMWIGAFLFLGMVFSFLF